MIPTSKLRKAMRDISAKKGPFIFFGVLLRENSVGGEWDLVVSAPWLKAYDRKSFSEFAKLFAKSLGNKAIVQLARISVVPPTDPTLRKLISAHSVDDGEVRIERTTLFGNEIDDGIILRAKRAA
jgi:hypothetical protein